MLLGSYRAESAVDLTWATSTDLRERRTFYQYRADRARRSLHGIDTQIAIASKAAIKRNRFVQLAGGTRSLNRDLETKLRTLAGWKPYVTNLLDADPTFVIASYHQLWHVGTRSGCPSTTVRREALAV